MHGPLRQYLNNLAGAAGADDILQEVAFKVFRKIKHLREPRVFMAWTFRIATRVAFDHLKKAKQIARTRERSGSGPLSGDKFIRA